MAVPTTSPWYSPRRSSIRCGSPRTRTRSRCRAIELAALVALSGCRSIIGLEEPADHAACATVDDCGGPFPYCHPETSTCVACDGNTDCASGLCDPDGSCVAPAQIAFASANGDGGECTQASPCQLQTALQSEKPDVVVVDQIAGAVIISRDVRLFGGPEGELHNSSNLPALAIYGGTVEIHRLRIFADVSLFGAHGINVVGKTAVVRLVELEVANHGGAGVVATGGDVTITRSRIHHNGDGGVRMVAPTKFAITDNFIYFNGDPASSAGGVYLDGDESSTFAFNTVVGNRSYAQSPHVAGISCKGALAINNLVYGNEHGTDPTQVKGPCTFANTESGMDATIVQFTKDDYHLTDATPAKLRDVIECTGYDIDHERRPQNGACDLGADELLP
jgi:hypothetical protein